MAGEVKGWEGLLKIQGTVFYFQTLSGPKVTTTTFRTDKSQDGAWQQIIYDKHKIEISGMAQWRAGDNPHQGALNLAPGAELAVSYWPRAAEVADSTKSYRGQFVVISCGVGSIDAREGAMPFELALESTGTCKVYGES